ncbi:CRE-DOD-6 protein [Caenorhabditis remanei]|uniref:CRE-DOD-6 protein n=2 Tax=Caenorhabditis TaxID=6237 RepID=E3LRX6_CAERE|nr:CRE-DOD-6 protein [Caenorhabditis remanei]
MFSLKTIALYFLVIMSVFVVYTSATCADDEDGHCAVFAELCDNADFAAYTSKCAKTCGKC